MEPSSNQDIIINTTPNKPSKTGLIVGIIICIILALGGIGFGVYGMFYKNIISGSSSPEKQGQNSSQEDNSKELSVYESRDLISKTFRLLGDRNGLSRQDYYDSDSGMFMIYADYMPKEQLIANELTDSLKTYITLETTLLDKEKTCNYQWTDGVKTDIDAIMGRLGFDIQFGNSYIDCASFGKLKNDYYDLWGEDLLKLEAFNTYYGDFAYSENLDVYYYHIIGGRGGTSSSYVVGKISKIGSDEEYGYIDINAGRFYINTDTRELYSNIEKGDLYKTIELDYDIYSNGLNLTEDDYASFQLYRFKFKKNSDGIYSFSTVEKM